jgi:uncharacterized protein YjbJ (UPF0337 family)
MGIGEEIKGKVKQVAGDVTDNDDLRREGKAQEEKGKAEVSAAVHKAKAKGYEAEAEEKRAEERANQGR